MKLPQRLREIAPLPPREPAAHISGQSRSWLIALFLASLVTPGPLARAQKVSPQSRGGTTSSHLTLDALFDANRLWTLTPEQAEAQFKPLGFAWLSEKSKDRALLRPPVTDRKPAQFTALSADLKVTEVMLSFQDGKISEALLTIWSRGDADEGLTEREFESLVDSWTTKLTTRLACNYENRGRDTASASKAERRLWVGPHAIAQLEYSGGKAKVADFYSGRLRNNGGFQAEFLRLRLAPKPKSLVGVDPSSGGPVKVNRAGLARRVKRDPGGDVILPNVPMVDQGDKGYCAVAAATRILNYYGVRADQTDLAQVTRTNSRSGTNPKEMEDALGKLQARYNVRYKTMLGGSVEFTDRGYRRLMDDYNRAAKRLGRILTDSESYYSVGGLDPVVLREIRGKGAPYDRFIRIVRESIDKGVPLLWGMQLGLYPENGQKTPQSGGCHMRLIIGYNFKNPSAPEIIFSDTWGAGHELKRMAAADASAATNGIYAIEPTEQ